MGRLKYLFMCFLIMVLLVGLLMGFLMGVINIFYNQIIQIILQYMDCKGLILGQIKYILY